MSTDTPLPPASLDVSIPNQVTFRDVLAKHYRDLYASDPEYAYAKSRITAEHLATKMTVGLAVDRASKDGKGIQRTCRELKIPYTYKAIIAYLNPREPALPVQVDTETAYGSSVRLSRSVKVF